MITVDRFTDKYMLLEYVVITWGQNVTVYNFIIVLLITITLHKLGEAQI